MTSRALSSRGHVVAFVDFDGVISINQPAGEEPRLSALDRLVPERVARLNAIVACTGCRVVVSSSWRFDPRDGGGMRMAQLESVLRLRGFTGTVYGITPHLGPSEWISDIAEGRGTEILAWCAEQREKPRAIVVLDDVRLVGSIAPFLVQTDEDVGLTDHDAELAVAMLTRPARAGRPWIQRRARRAAA